MTVSRLAYATREDVKRAARIYGPDQDARVDRAIQSSSEAMENDCRTWFVPRFFTRFFDWPTAQPGIGYRLWLDGHLLTVTELLVRALDPVPLALTSGQYFLEPQRLGPPYTRIDINLATGAAYQAGLTYQRSIAVTGPWAYSQRTAPAGTLALDMTPTDTVLICADSSLVGVGDALLIDAEQLLVADRSLVKAEVALMQDLTGAGSGLTEQSIFVSDGALVSPGEVVTIDAERMFVESVSTNNLQVVRQYDGSTLASHATGADLYVPRKLTVERAQGKGADETGGTTATSHIGGVPIARYQAPNDVQDAVLAKSIVTLQQELAAYAGSVGSGESFRANYGGALAGKWGDCVRRYFKSRSWAV